MLDLFCFPLPTSWGRFQQVRGSRHSCANGLFQVTELVVQTQIHHKWEWFLGVDSATPSRPTLHSCSHDSICLSTDTVLQKVVPYLLLCIKNCISSGQLFKAKGESYMMTLEQQESGHGPEVVVVACSDSPDPIGNFSIVLLVQLVWFYPTILSQSQ